MRLLRDLQFGWRSLTRTPMVSLVAVLSMVIGIGANTALFNLLNACLFRALPVDHAEQLVILTDPTASGVQEGVSSGERDLLSYPEFEELKSMKSLSGLFATESNLERYDASIAGAESERIYGRMVSGAFFSTLRQSAQLGRFFDASADGQIGQAPFAVLSDGFWERRFGRSPDVIGTSIKIRRALVTIIGVAPRGFFGETVGNKPDLWIPLTMQALLIPGRDWLHPSPDPTQKVQWLHVFGRLQPGYSLARAQIEANVIFKRDLEESYASLSGDVKREFMDQRIRLKPAASGASELRDSRVQQPLFILFAAVGVVLLICCVNVTNLLLARANTRRREIMIRLALGAKKADVIRQLLTEALIVSLLGGAGGLLVAQTGAELLARMVSTPNDPVQLDITQDARVLLFTAGIAVLTAVLFGLAPALRAARTEIGTTLRGAAGGMTPSSAKMLLSKVFVVAQIAFSLALVVGAGLLLRTLLNLKKVDLGYLRERVLTMRVDGLGTGYRGQQVIALYDRLQGELANAPGVRAVTYSENGLLSSTDSSDDVEVEGYVPLAKRDLSVRWDEVAPGYFSSLGIPVLLGREITARDQPGTPQVCVVNQTFARKYFRNRNPVGRHFATVYGTKKVAFEIVGVARDIREHRLRGDEPPRFFSAVRQMAPEIPESVYFEVRTSVDPNAALPTLRRVIQRAEPNATIMTARSVMNLVNDRTRTDRLVARITGLFGGVALLMAAIGIYGVLAYAVSQRTVEIGIRMAIGAEAGKVIRMILRETGMMLGAGLAAGIALSAGVARLISSQLVGVRATDPFVLVTAIGLIAGMGILAGYGPALRASRVDPVRALRNG
jgi:predicted permease